MEERILVHSADIYHWGIKGQKWGTRRYQNEDGTLTEAGKAHYGKQAGKALVRASVYETNVKKKSRTIGIPLYSAAMSTAMTAHFLKKANQSKKVIARNSITNAVSSILGSATAAVIARKIYKKKKQTYDNIISKYGKEIAKDYIDKFNKKSNIMVPQKYKNKVNENYKNS